MKKVHTAEKTRRFDMLKDIKTIFPSYTCHMIRMPDKVGHLQEARLDLETIIPVGKDGKYYLVPATESVDLKKVDNMIAPLSRFTDNCIHIQNTYLVHKDDWEHEEFKEEKNPGFDLEKYLKKRKN